jgi:hypothetical protein
MVVELGSLSRLQPVDEELGWFGEFGKFRVSNVQPALCRSTCPLVRTMVPVRRVPL